MAGGAAGQGGLGAGAGEDPLEEILGGAGSRAGGLEGVGRVLRAAQVGIVFSFDNEVG
jgi:hypothetical protein